MGLSVRLAFSGLIGPVSRWFCGMARTLPIPPRWPKRRPSSSRRSPRSCGYPPSEADPTGRLSSALRLILSRNRSAAEGFCSRRPIWQAAVLRPSRRRRLRRPVSQAGKEEGCAEVSPAFYC